MCDLAGVPDINGDALHASLGLPPALAVDTARVGKLEITVRCPLPSTRNFVYFQLPALLFSLGGLWAALLVDVCPCCRQLTKVRYIRVNFATHSSCARVQYRTAIVRGAVVTLLVATMYNLRGCEKLELYMCVLVLNDDPVKLFFLFSSAFVLNLLHSC